MDGVEASIACRWIMKGLTGNPANAGTYCKSPRSPTTDQLKVVSNNSSIKKITQMFIYTNENFIFFSFFHFKVVQR